jgi:hypothetical protein
VTRSRSPAASPATVKTSMTSPGVWASQRRRKGGQAQSQVRYWPAPDDNRSLLRIRKIRAFDISRAANTRRISMGIAPTARVSSAQRPKHPARTPALRRRGRAHSASVGDRRTIMN